VSDLAIGQLKALEANSGRNAFLANRKQLAHLLRFLTASKISLAGAGETRAHHMLPVIELS
jgi:hypothetical protein